MWKMVYSLWFYSSLLLSWRLLASPLLSPLALNKSISPIWQQDRRCSDTLIASRSQNLPFIWFSLTRRTFPCLPYSLNTCWWNMKWARSSEARKTQTLGPELSPWIFYSAAQKHHYAYHNGNIFHINPFHCFFLGCKLTCTCLSHTQTHTKRSHQKANTPKKNMSKHPHGSPKNGEVAGPISFVTFPVWSEGSPAASSTRAPFICFSAHSSSELKWFHWRLRSHSGFMLVERMRTSRQFC